MTKQINLVEKKINESLAKIRPALQLDGGDVSLLSWDSKTGIVTVRMLGMCSGCPMAQMTLQQGIAQTLKNDIPEIKKVIQA